MPKGKTRRFVAGIAASFVGFVGMIGFLSAEQIVTATVAKLMLVALFGLYVGFGVLVAVYRLINKLE